MSASPGQPNNEKSPLTYDAWRRQGNIQPDEQSVEPAKTFEEWLRERGGPEGIAKERRETIAELGVESVLKEIMEPEL